MNPHLRYLSTADGSNIVAQTETQIVFGAPVSLVPGEVFFVPENGVYRAVSVTTSGGQTIVATETPTLDEVFARLDVQGDIDLGAVELPAQLQPNPGDAAGERKALAVQNKSVEFDKVVIARTFDDKGTPGLKIDFNVQVSCGGTATDKKLRFLEVRAEIFGPISYKANKADIAASSVSYRYKLRGGVYAGCKLVLRSDPILVGTMRFPVPGAPLLMVNIPIYLSAKLETDMVGTFRVLELNAEGSTPASDSPTPSSNLTDASTYTPLLAEASIGKQFTVSLSAELDFQARLIAFVNLKLAAGGAKMGPKLEVKAEAVTNGTGARLDVCATLNWPVELYVNTPFFRQMKNVVLFKKDFSLPYASFAQCLIAPSGNWRFTTTSCQPMATNSPECNVYCNPTTDFALAANEDRSRISVKETSTSTQVLVELEPFVPPTGPPPPRTYSGCWRTASGACDTLFLGMEFSADYRSAPWWNFVGFYGSCGFVQEGTAALR